ncbi:hypothetical protein [Niastella sp. OAS944]|uniref:hypothetical protein n=1 Tax=Niastella sp. OAS944 TaxID=2664089 RepID=UPI00346A78FF|nr:hypothetical protein [Chitinophagaceae bacterium OAS944]
MRTDERYIAVRRMIQAGDITMLNQCFNIIPKSIVAEDLGEHKGRYSTRLTGIENMTYKDIKNLSSLFEIDITIVFKLIDNQARSNEASKQSVFDNKN